MSLGAGRSGGPIVRLATPADASTIVALMAELGYPDSPAAIEARVARTQSGGAVLLAEQDGRVAAVASVHLIPLFHCDRFLARITSFVVTAGLRGRGVGSTLLQASESWSREHGAERIEITSGDERDDAHGFYERRGFARQGQRFSKWLSAGDARGRD